jgi:hypothetical protein
LAFNGFDGCDVAQPPNPVTANTTVIATARRIMPFS